MDKFFRRSMNKKGFTILELVVVLAIIGILAAMILPNLFASDVPTKAKGYAKSYFFTAQEFFSRQKIAEDARAELARPPYNNVSYDTFKAIPNSVLYLYTTVDSFGRPTESGVLPGTGTPTSSVTSADIAANTSISEPYKKLVADFTTYMEQNLTECDYEGTYFVVVDDNFRVTGAYWADATFDELLAASPDFEFEDDGVVGGYWVGAFPVELCLASGTSSTREMFVF